jgi:iron-sulfur cluster repair protein YtfE (RIC family)
MAETSLPLARSGRFTAIAGDHQRLSVRLRRLHDLCAALESERPVIGPELDPTTLLAELSAALTRHFEIEEADAYFGAIVQERPSVLHTIAELKLEHAAMLHSLVELGLLAADDRRWKELGVPISRLIAQLKVHEHAENELLQELVLRDEGSGSD